MADPVTIGALTASALAMAGEAALKGAVGEAAKDAYKALKSRTGQFTSARPWYERAVAAREKGDVHGRVDHNGLGVSLHQVGYCLQSSCDVAAARAWYERAVSAKQKGNIHSRVDRQSLALSIRAIQDLR